MIIVIEAGSGISQNGDDAIELYEQNQVIETFGDINIDGTGEEWEYTDSWAYKVGNEWTYGGVNCTDDSETSLQLLPSVGVLVYLLINKKFILIKVGILFRLI